MTTLSPPAVLPTAGAMPVMTGAGALTKVKRSAEVTADVPLPVMTCTLKVPAAPAAVVMVHLVAVQDWFEGKPPPLTSTSPVLRLCPVTVTVVPPVVGPDFGEIPVITGTAFTNV